LRSWTRMRTASSREEAAGAGRSAKRCDATDTNKNSKRSRERLTARRKRMHGKLAAKLKQKFGASDAGTDQAVLAGSVPFSVLYSALSIAGLGAACQHRSPPQSDLSVG
jgi:hypothetical protein